MNIDVNAYLGHFAFRRLRHNTSGELVRLMDSKGIDRAVVSSIAAVTYRNPQSGNEDLADAVKSHRDRLIPFAVINPSYAGWQDDLQICHDEFGMTGLRLYPKWHDYELADSCTDELIEAATERNMPISIPLRVEDDRQRSWLVDVPDVPHAELADLVERRPKAKFIFVNGSGFNGSPLGNGSRGLPANYWIEISRLSALTTNEIGRLIATLGPDRLVFGTGMPLKYPDPALLKLEVLDETEETINRIRWQNASTVLGLNSGA